jgi:hypothetical protein
MIALPKLILILLISVLVWYAVRRINRAAPKAVRRRQQAAPRAQATVEDLTACRVCGAYVAASARACGTAGCPRLR